MQGGCCTGGNTGIKLAEDVADIVLNVKNLVVQLEGDEPRTMTLSASGPGDVTAELIDADTAVTILNKDLVLATLTDAVDFEMELRVAKGRGYVPASEQFNADEDQEIGRIPVDAIYSPVQRVRYKVEDTRVGQRTNYDKLILEVWTNGTASPEMALVEAAKIFRKHLNPFVHYQVPGEDAIVAESAVLADEEKEKEVQRLRDMLSKPIEDLDLSVRARNCLDAENLASVGELVRRTEADLLRIKNFGKTSLKEIKKKLTDLGLSLGMDLPDNAVPSESRS